MSSSLFVLAQAAPAPAQAQALSVVGLVGGILGVVALFVGPLIWYGMRQDRLKREMEHAERMRALELGHPLPDSSAIATIKTLTGVGPNDEWSPVKRCFATAMWLPILAFVGSLVFGNRGDAHTGLWIATAVIGGASVICGTILALRMPHSTADGYANSAWATRKPIVDPDAYDVAARG